MVIFALVFNSLGCAMPSRRVAESGNDTAKGRVGAVDEFQVVNTRYTPDQAGFAMRDEDVIRASGLVFDEEEIRTFRFRSVLGCPTYGCCDSCWNAGPIDMGCPFCSSDRAVLDADGSFLNRFGMVVSTDGGCGERKIVDAEKLSRLFGKEVLSAEAGYSVIVGSQVPETHLTKTVFWDMIRRKYAAEIKELF